MNVLMQDYELQLVTYKALAEPIASPLKKTKMESVSDDIIQEVPLISDIHPFFISLYVQLKVLYLGFYFLIVFHMTC